MITTPLRLGVLCLVPVLIAGATTSHQPSADREQTQAESKRLDEKQREENTLKVHYLEIVTASVNETCDALEKAHSVTFGEPIAELGNARAAELKGGGRIGVRAPMRETEEPVVRPYVLVDDINAAVKAAETAGAQVAVPPMETSHSVAFFARQRRMGSQAVANP